MKNYLPSKQFVARLIILGGLLSISFGIYKLALFLKDRRTGKVVTNLTIKPDVIQKDTNKNGIPDWEESLWGLDPTKNGDSNKEFIVAKRQEIAKENGAPTDNNHPLTENETLSREFFAVVMSLQQSGNLDQDALKAVSDTVGKKIIAEPIPDVYTKDMATVKEEDDPTGVIEYYTAYINLTNKYKNKNIGDELSFIAAGLKDNDQGALNVAGSVSDAYRSFGKDLIKVPVPASLISLHLSLANDYEKVGQSIGGLTQLLSDPIVGMKSLLNYKKYNDMLVNDLQKLSDNFN